MQDKLCVLSFFLNNFSLVWLLVSNYLYDKEIMVQLYIFLGELFSVFNTFQK